MTDTFIRCLNLMGDFTFIPTIYGQFQPDQHGSLVALVYCPAESSIFATFTFNYGLNSSQINQYNATNLNLIKCITVSPVFMNENGNNILYDTSPRFIFADKTGSTLFVIKNLKETYNIDHWSLKRIGL